MAFHHSASVGSTSRTKSCRCCTRLVMICLSRRSGVFLKRSITAAVMLFSSKSRISCPQHNHAQRCGPRLFLPIRARPALCAPNDHHIECGAYRALPLPSGLPSAQPNMQHWNQTMTSTSDSTTLDRELAYAVFRLTLGINILVHGAGRIFGPGAGAFASTTAD